MGGGCLSRRVSVGALHALRAFIVRVLCDHLEFMDLENHTFVISNLFAGLCVTGEADTWVCARFLGGHGFHTLAKAVEQLDLQI